MANFFDQFDEAPPAGQELIPQDFGDRPNFANFFDQFDPDPAVTGGPPIPQPRIPDMRGAPPTTGESVLQGFESFSQGVIDPALAAGQIATRAFPQGGPPSPLSGASLVGGILPLAAQIANTAGLTPTSGEVDKFITAREKDLQAARGPDAGIDFSRLAGNIVGTLPAALAAPSTIPGAIAAGTTVGVLQPAVTEEEQQNFGETKAKQALLGAAGGAGGTLIGRGVARVISPQTRQAVTELLTRKITPTPGQVLGGGFQTFENKLMSVPLLGSAIRSGQSRAVREFNTAIFDDILRPIGARAPKAVGREAVEEVGNTVSRSFDDILPRLNMRVDQQLIDDVVNLRAIAAELPPSLAKRFETVMRDRVIGPLSKDAGGRGFKQVESALTREAARFSKSGDAFQRELGDTLTDLLGSLRDGLARSNAGVRVNVGGQVVDAGQRVQALNLAWAKLVRLEKAAGATGAAEGVFTPAQFSAAVKAADQSTRKRAFARGDALMQEISDPAKSVLSSNIPNSGTADRLLAAMLAGGAIPGAAFAPVPTALAAGGIGAASLPFTPIGQRLTAALLARRPDIAPAVAQGVRSALPALTVGGAAAAANR